MIHKIKVVMEARDEKHKVNKIIEMDRGYFPAYQKKESNMNCTISFIFLFFLQLLTEDNLSDAR